jgi:hypothetical protein
MNEGMSASVLQAQSTDKLINLELIEVQIEI